MSYIPTFTLNQDQVSVDTAGRLRTSGLTTLGDYKELNYTRNILFDLKGTGTVSTSGADKNKFHMHVEANQWLVRQTYQHHCYFSGKSQLVEMTFDTFAPQNNVIKRIGYFSGNFSPPYNSDLDGIWLESANSTITLKIYNFGTMVYEKDWTQWKGYSQLQNYNWNLFNAAFIDFLWLGGATARLFLRTENGFVLADEYVHAQSASGVFFESPNQPIRYDITSTGGVGDFRPICSQVATEGSFNLGGFNRQISGDPAGTPYAIINQKMPVIAVRKKSSCHDVAALVNDLFIFTQTQDDRIYWTLERNPVLSGTAASWQSLSESALEYATFNDSTLVTTNGIVIADGILTYNVNVPTGVLKDSFLSWLGSSLDEVEDTVVLTMTPLVGTSYVVGGISIKEF